MAGSIKPLLTHLDIYDRKLFPFSHLVGLFQFTDKLVIQFMDLFRSTLQAVHYCLFISGMRIIFMNKFPFTISTRPGVFNFMEYYRKFNICLDN